MRRIRNTCFYILLAALLLQCLAMPIHGWVAVVNMYCAGLGLARKAVLLSTSRQGSCFLRIVYPLIWLFGVYGVASVQAAADLLSLLLAVPVIVQVNRMVREKMQEDPAREAWLRE